MGKVGAYIIGKEMSDKSNRTCPLLKMKHFTPWTTLPFILMRKDVLDTPCTLAAVVIGDPSCRAFIASNIACFDHCSCFSKGLLIMFLGRSVS